jgi:hypothetical protein
MIFPVFTVFVSGTGFPFVLWRYLLNKYSVKEDFCQRPLDERGEVSRNAAERNETAVERGATGV